ncbi:MAG: glycosyltransferase family 1 protein [Patescibacteria group bacterium]
MNNSNKPLIIDAQLLQTTAWDRGMGHYCRSLIEAFGKTEDSNNVTIIVNKHLHLDEQRKTQIQDLLPKATLAILDLPTLSGNIERTKHIATQKLDKFIKEKYREEEVNFLILQLFTFDYCAAFPTSANKFVLCYDLIPLLNWQKFSNYFAPHMYFPHLVTLLEANTVLAISNTTKQQLQDQLSINKDRIVVINGAYIERQPIIEFALVDRGTPFILMPTADLPHKNNEVAVKAFEQFNRELGGIFKLVITSEISEDTQQLLNCYSDNLIFSGNISDQQLEYLYQKSHAVLFLSSVEGLGLPILEAINSNKPVVCSNIPVFEEISQSAFYYCDPKQSDSVASALRAAVIQSGWENKQPEYNRIRIKYTWMNSAKQLVGSLKNKQVAVEKKKKRKINIALPHPSSTSSSLGAIAQSLVPALKDAFEINSFVSSDKYVNENVMPLFLDYMTTVEPIEKILDTKNPSVYFIDRSSASRDVLRMAILRPGVCFITTKDTTQLLEYLAQTGQITNKLASAGGRIAKNNLAGILTQTGNKVYLLDAEGANISSGQDNNTKSYTQTDDRWGLAQTIIQQVMKKTEEQGGGADD